MRPVFTPVDFNASDVKYVQPTLTAIFDRKGTPLAYLLLTYLFQNTINKRE